MINSSSTYKTTKFIVKTYKFIKNYSEAILKGIYMHIYIYTASILQLFVMINSSSTYKTAAFTA